MIQRQFEKAIAEREKAVDLSPNSSREQIFFASGLNLLPENSPNRFVGFRPLKLNRDKALILIGWVEARNPTFQMGLNPTYLKPDFSFRH